MCHCCATHVPAAAPQACTACRATGHSLAIWRASAGLKPAECEVLDRDHGSGWNLAAALLRPRQVQVSPCFPCLQAGRPCLRVEALVHAWGEQVRGASRHVEHTMLDWHGCLGLNVGLPGPDLLVRRVPAPVVVWRLSVNASTTISSSRAG